MTKDNLPPEPVMGQHKRHLTEKAKLAAESRLKKKVKMPEGSQAIPNTSTTTITQKRKVSIEEVDDEDDFRWSPPPRNPKHILEGPDDDEEEELQPQKKARTSTERYQVTKDMAGSSNLKSTATHRKVSIEEIDDEDHLRQSRSPHNPKHILEGPDDDDEDVEVIEVHSDVPEKPAESAEAELSEITQMSIF